MLADNGLIPKENTDIICNGKQSVRQLGRLPKLTDTERSETAGYSVPGRATILASVELAI
jgi:hypothetical protein